MPELPDLTIFAGNLKKRLGGRTVTGVAVHNFSKVNAAQQAFEAGMVGSQISDVAREGKELAFTFSSGAVMNIHMMLAGKLTLVLPGKVESVRSKLFSFTIDDAAVLVLSDQMGMAKATLNPPPPKSPDALSPEFTFEYFQKLVKRSPMFNIKELITMPNKVRGIGNAYADEILWKANISPMNFAGKIPEDALKRLYEAISEVLLHAIEQIKRISPDIISGEERSFLSVHNPKKEFADDGEKILVTEQNKRKTYYTAKQVVYP